MRFLILTLLLITCASCSKERTPHVVITVSGSKPLYLYDGDESRKQIYHSLAGPTNKFHNPSVTIQLASGATYALAQEAMDMCTMKGLWKITVVNDSGASVEDEFLEWKASSASNKAMQATPQ